MTEDKALKIYFWSAIAIIVFFAALIFAPNILSAFAQEPDVEIISENGSSSPAMVLMEEPTLEDKILMEEISRGEIVDEIQKIKDEKRATEILLSKYAEQNDFLRNRAR